MSTMKIQVVAVEVTNRGKYDQAEVTFKNLSFGDKVEAKKLMSFVNKDVYATIKNASNGDVFTVSRVKDDKGYWQWTGIAVGDDVPAGATAGGNVAAPSKAASPSPKSTYETPEERAKRQVLIVRQSSLSSAIELLKTDKKSPTVPEVLQVAKQFESYVFGNDDPFGLEEKPNKLPTLDDLEDDIPM